MSRTKHHHHRHWTPPSWFRRLAVADSVVSTEGESGVTTTWRGSDEAPSRCDVGVVVDTVPPVPVEGLDERQIDALLERAQSMNDRAKGEITDAADDRLIDAVDALVSVICLLRARLAAVEGAPTAAPRREPEA